MKKLSTLFGLLVLFLANAVTVKAQTPTAEPITSAEVPTGYYFIASTESTAYDITSPYIAANGGTMKLVAQSAVTTDVSSSTVGLWYIEKTGTNTYTIKSQETGTYWSAGTNAPLGGSAGVYNINQTATDANSYYFSGNGGGINNHGYVNATNATAFERNNSGSYNKWKLIPAGVQNITLNYTVGTRTFSSSKLVATGTEVNPSLDFYTNFQPTTVSVVEGTDTYNVTCTANFPFEEGKYYKMKIRWNNDNDRNNDKTDGVYTYRSVVWDGTDKGKISTREAVTESNNALWKIEIVSGTANQAYLCNAVSGEKVTIDNTNDGTRAYMSSTGTKFYVKKGNTGDNYTNGFRLASLSNNNASINDVSGTLGYWTNSNSPTDAGSTFTIYEATQPTSQTINTIVATNTATNEAITIENVNAQANLTTTGKDILVHNSFFTLSNGTYDSENQKLTIDYTTTAPYTISGTTTDNKAWQIIRTRYDGATPANCYLKVNGENIQSRYNTLDKTSLTAIRTFNNTDANKWAIIPAEATFNKFYFVNKSDETKKAYLANEEQGTLVTMSSENATAFYLAAQPTFSGITGGFTIQPNNTNNHAVGDHDSGSLCYWSNRNSSELNDAGSIFRIANLVDDCKALVPTTTDYVGCFSADAQASLKADAITTCEAFFAKYDEVKASSASYITPDPNKFYRITFTRGNVSPSLVNSTASADGTINEEDALRLVTYVAQSTNTPSAIVKFEKIDGEDHFYIKDVNSGLYYGSKNSSDGKLYGVKNTQWAGHYDIKYSINGTLSNLGIYNASASSITDQYMWSRGETESSILSDWNAVWFHSPYNNNAETGDETSIEAGCVVKAQEATTYPVTITEAGYASLCLPFSVTLPEGLTANKVTAVGDTNELNLVSLNGTVAAGEPVILSGEAGSYTLTINSEEGTKTTDNLLSGTNVKRTGITDTYYALGYKAVGSSDTKTAGLFKVSTENMPANKAYLLKTNIPAAQQSVAMFSFNFGGITGINNATTAPADANIYYDLQGRRVLYPAHGIFVKANGQKVFIK